jgi:arylsulfatase A-like enzyme
VSLFPRRWGWLFLPALVYGCGGGQPENLATVELLARIPLAEKHWDGTLLELGSPAVRPFLDEGWSHGETDSEGQAYRWAFGDKSRFHFNSEASGTHIAWIECEPFTFEGAPTQVLDLSVNGVGLPPLPIGEGRNRRYPLQLDLVEGVNEVEIGFAYTRAPGDVDPGSTDRRRLSAAFYRFEVPPKNTNPVMDEPGAFSLVRPSEASAGIYLPKGGRLSYFLEVPEGAHLTVTVGARNPEQLLVPAGAGLEIEALPENGDSLRTFEEASAPRGEVLTAELSLTPLAGKRTELSFRAVESNLFVSPHLTFPLVGEAATEPESEAQFVDGLNVLMIVLDGATALRMGPYGYSRPTTPEIDKLAAESIIFDQAITQAVYTVASIGSVLTGQYPERHQSVSFADRLPSSAVTLPGILSQNGILSAGFSGNAVVSPTFGLDRGYEEFYPVRELEGYTGHGDSVLRAFLDWLGEECDERFFAYVHFREPHFPYNPPPPYDTRFGPSQPFTDGIVDWQVVERFNQDSGRGEEVPSEVIERIRGLYDGNMAYVDSLVGEMLAKLEALDLHKNTLVIVTADHGEALFEHGYIGHNTQLYEESIRVPLMMRIPDSAPHRISDVVELVDLAPTVLELAGLGDLPVVTRMQGRSLVPLIQGEPVGARVGFSRTLWDKPRYSVRDNRFKLIWDSRADTLELYDLKEDPEESSNLVGERRVIAGFLRQRLYGWLREQEHLRAGAPAPESVIIEDDLRRQLDALGYVEFLDKEKKK